MNITDDMICQTCLISNGFSQAERTSYITQVVLVSIALVSTYIGVLWFAIHTRDKPEKTPIVTTHSNEAFDNRAFNDEDEDYDDYIQPVDKTRRGRSPSTRELYPDRANGQQRP